jgi:hypothetical protein
MGTTSTTAITATIPANGKLYLKATVNNWASAPTYVNVITATGNHNVGGNIMSLLYNDNFENQTTLSSDYIFASLFKNNNKLVNAQKLVLPATALREYCYSNMFNGCTRLTTAPTLPATTLTNYCYMSMFYGCSALTTAPELPATTLALNCYSQMFQGCSALTTAPALPATTLKNSCYGSMFQGCSALTTAPALPATTLTQSCYQSMFFNCSSLTTSPELPATTLVTRCYSTMFSGCRNLNKVTIYANSISASYALANWLNNVAATGDFYNLGGATYSSGTSGIPSGWTEHTSL